VVRMIEGCSPRDLTPFRVSYMYQPVYLLGSIKSAAIPPILVSPLPALPAHRQSQILAAWNPQLHALGWAISRHSYKTSRTGLHNQYVEHRQLVRPADTPSPSRPRPYSGATSHIGTLHSHDIRPYLGARRHIQRPAVPWSGSKKQRSLALEPTSMGVDQTTDDRSAAERWKHPALDRFAGGAGRSGYRFAHAPRWSAQLDVARSNSRAYRKRLAYPLLPCRMHGPDGIDTSASQTLSTIDINLQVRLLHNRHKVPENYRARLPPPGMAYMDIPKTLCSDWHPL